jgi:hypothetical protein
MKKLFFISFFSTCLTLAGHSQLSLKDLDMERIPQRKIRQYIEMQSNRDVQLLTDFKASCYSSDLISDPDSLNNTYLIKENPDSLWKIYQNKSIIESWNSKKISFGLLFSRESNHIYYGDESEAEKIDTGQVFFINLRILGGMVHLPVGIEIVKIDEHDRSIMFSYLEGNKTLGNQIMKLESDRDGYTRIIHSSYFRSDSPFRDKHLYPFFHTRVINNLHREMARDITSEKGYFRIIH